VVATFLVSSLALTASAAGAQEQIPPPNTCKSYPSTDVPRPIRNLSLVVSAVNVGEQAPIADLDVGPISISHTRDADLDIYLMAPNGAWSELLTDVGGTKANFAGTVLDDEAKTPITQASAPFTGAFRPEGSLARFDGLNSQGTWRLLVFDDAPGHKGSLQSWQLGICPKPPSPPGACMTYPGSDLPKPIVDFGTVTSLVAVGDDFVIGDVNVELSITHTYVGDLVVKLTDSDGRQLTLANRQGGSGDNFSGTVFDDEATTSISEASAPFTGHFRLAELSFYEGRSAVGTWVLSVQDAALLDEGTLDSWSLVVCTSTHA
jgi:subtilisin-like proprotein convertase family protein